MKVIIVGGVAAGTKVAAKLKREDASHEVIILNKGKDISYAGCGLPYYVGNIIKMKEDLVINTPEMFEKRTGSVVHTEVEVTSIDRKNKTVTAMDLTNGQEAKYPYDKLVIATGARPIKPTLEGVDLLGVYFLRTPEDAVTMREDIKEKNMKKVAVIGGGYIGLEIAENLLLHGMKVYIVEMSPRVLIPFDEEFSEKATEIMTKEGITVLAGTKLESIEGKDHVERIKTSVGDISVDAVVMSVGIRPNTEFLKDSGIELMPNNTIKVNEYLQTNDPDIYSAGDCVAVKNIITNEYIWSPMGSSANIEGRVLALNLNGEKIQYRGVLGTAVAKIAGINIAKTGLNEEEAKKFGFKPVSVVAVVNDKAHYYPDSSDFTIKLIADEDTLKVLGVQVFGTGVVDKIVDVIVMAISMNATLHDLEDLDFAYAPPFSTPIHPLVHLTNILFNKIQKKMKSLSPGEFLEKQKKEKEDCGNNCIVVDAGAIPSLKNCVSINLTELCDKPDNLEENDEILLVCKKGKGAYLSQCRLKCHGYEKTKVLEGGTTFNKVEK